MNAPRDIRRAYAAAMAQTDAMEVRLHDLEAHIREARSLARQAGVGVA